MDNKFSIGQMAKLNNVSIKTLRYYDKIGLFKPFLVDISSGYRYYSVEQFKELDIILYLKMMGVSLKDIKKQLENRSLDDFISILENVRKKTREKIEVLKQIEQDLFSRVSELEHTKNDENIGKPFIQHLQAHNVIQVNKKVGSIREIEGELRKLKSNYENITPIVIGNVGYLMNLKDFKNDESSYDGIFLLVDQPLNVQIDKVTPLDEGDFAVIRWREKTNNDDRKYIEKLIRYVNAHHYETEGPIYIRKIVSGIISNNPEEWLKEIRIKVNKLTLH